MSEKCEGWMGYESRIFRGVWDSPNPEDSYIDPVWVQPLDPDGPKPGEIWKTVAGTRLEILSPPCHGVVIVRGPGLQDGRPLGYNVRHLSPIKPTRTVTVELTEEDAETVEWVRQNDFRFPGVMCEWVPIAKKLAEALEDE